MKSKAKILIVDDEPINLEFFDVMLSKLGFAVEKAEDGDVALEKIKECDPDLIILDNVMPKLSGWEVTKILKNDKHYKDFRYTPIIMFSAMDEVKDKIEGLELGVDDYITKPFNFSEVLARIRVVLRNRELSRQVTRRESRISVIESLNKSLIYFTQHIKKPFTKLSEKADKIDISKPDEVKELITLIKEESDMILASISGLEDEIKELQGKGDDLKRGDLTLDDLERKYQKNLQQWKEKEINLEGVHN
ncbi:MAG: response regulator transcription factor [Spirochaetales bacterium]|nr:response regulator transcription factor [Spirochaetales bacterium]